jgi:nucleotide-binding universal stress UspA family protein
MSFSTIMVHLDLAGANEAPLRIAADLAERFDARLIGTCASDIQPLYFMDGAAAQEMLEQERKRLLQEMAAQEQRFRKALTQRAAKIEWRSGIAWPADFVSRECRAADLIIVGTSDGRSHGLRQINPGELVLRAGRPVLIVPAAIEWLKFGSMLIAWKDAREARRAVNDALPLLHKAKNVTVVELMENNADAKAAKSRLDDVAAWLVRRGISATTIATRALTAVPDRLAQIAKDEGADIVVAGAYGHTRIQEWVFGGVTRGLLKQQECCVLMSH